MTTIVEVFCPIYIFIKQIVEVPHNFVPQDLTDFEVSPLLKPLYLTIRRQRKENPFTSLTTKTHIRSPIFRLESDRSPNEKLLCLYPSRKPLEQHTSLL